MARSFHQRFWPEVKLVPFVLPWTVFHGKYHLHRWPWKSLFALCRQLRAGQSDVALSTRWDPREHLLLRLSGAKERLGFPRLGSQWWLTQSLQRLSPLAHRYDDWWVAARALQIDLPARKEISAAPRPEIRTIVIHTGAGSPVRVWPLERYQRLADRLHQQGYQVRLLCDPDQKEWWFNHGQTDIVVPASVDELMGELAPHAAFIGNDSGPGHLAALLGIPTFTFFGPQLADWFAPLHPLAEWIDGKSCPYRQCFDYCRYPEPHCIRNISEEEAEVRIEVFVKRALAH
jgi:heptosyltransferase-2